VKITGRWLHGESISGQILHLDEPLSFWGGLDPSTGEIIDQAHPQAGASMAGVVVAMPGSRRSSGTPGVLGEAPRTGAGPAALIVTKADINLVAGAMVAGSLYGVDCPVLLVDGDTFASLTTGTRVEHSGPGSLVD
jgi:predicted aconitase with swiveling domain